jgi:hypothetical protein
MKKLKDCSVPSRCYYYVLDWRDANMEQFVTIIKKPSVNELSHAEFWLVFNYITTMDVLQNGITDVELTERMKRLSNL